MNSQRSFDHNHAEILFHFFDTSPPPSPPPTHGESPVRPEITLHVQECLRSTVSGGGAGGAIGRRME